MRSPLKHVVGKCKSQHYWRDLHLGSVAVLKSTPEAITLSILSARPGTVPFSIAVHMCAELDKEADRYWSARLQEKRCSCVRVIHNLCQVEVIEGVILCQRCPVGGNSSAPVF